MGEDLGVEVRGRIGIYYTGEYNKFANVHQLSLQANAGRLVNRIQIRDRRASIEK